MESQTIEYKVPSMSDQIIGEQLSGELILYDDCLVNRMEFYCDETKDSDPDIWLRDVHRSFDSMFLKRFITGSTVRRSELENNWILQVWVLGVSSMDLFFEHENHCREMAGTINKWLLA